MIHFAQLLLCINSEFRLPYMFVERHLEEQWLSTTDLTFKHAKQTCLLSSSDSPSVTNKHYEYRSYMLYSGPGRVN